ncbi:MAG: hypothetical protein KBC46_03565 [Ferrovibrio sp.]|nr:hypothetical protein [Ferrovibrio sp.]
MSFRELYDYCQTFPGMVGRNAVVACVRELLPRAPFSVIQDGLDPTICRGYYLSARNDQHRVVQQLGGRNVIVLARLNNRCWTRFVLFKEMMHLFDDPMDSTTQAVHLDAVMLAFENTGQLPNSPQLRSELETMWMAAALLCPEHQRVEYMRRNTLDQADPEYMDDLQIAMELRMPQQWVQRLFQPRYRKILDALLGVPEQAA